MKMKEERGDGVKRSDGREARGRIEDGRETARDDEEQRKITVMVRVRGDEVG